jgi:CheY-like chemotaxis protein
MILVVDDTPANIDILLETIGEEDEVSVAISGEDALELIEEEPPDLVLLDVMMPGIDGFEVCKRLKADPKTAGIPIVFLSGMDSAEEKQKGLDLGAVDFLTKPIDPSEVMKVIKKFT